MVTYFASSTRFRMECRYVSQTNTRHSLLTAGGFFHKLFANPGRLFGSPIEFSVQERDRQLRSFLVFDG